MDRLFKIESYHDDGKGSVDPKHETFIRAASADVARKHLAKVFGVNSDDLLLSVYPGQPPVDSMVLVAETSAAAA